jgi:hypothetical protein
VIFGTPRINPHRYGRRVIGIVEEYCPVKEVFSRAWTLNDAYLLQMAMRWREFTSIQGTLIGQNRHEFQAVLHVVD